MKFVLRVGRRRVLLTTKRLALVLLVAVVLGVGVISAVAQIWPLVALSVLALLVGVPLLLVGLLGRAGARLAVARLMRRLGGGPGAVSAALAAHRKATYPYGIGPDGEYARRCAEGVLRPFETFILQSRSLAARNVLARVTTGGRYDWPDLVRLVRLSAGGYRAAKTEVNAFAPDALCSLARVMVHQRSQPADLHDARLIYENVLDRGMERSFLRGDRYLYLEAAAATDDPDIVDRAARIARLDSRDPFHVATVRANVARLHGSEDEWLDALNVPYRAAELEEIALRPGEGTRFDRLEVRAEPRDAATDPLISVIMPTFGAGDRIQTAIDSLLTQSWTNLEILIVDDFSDEATRVSLAKIAEQDPRIRLLLQPSNQGAYAARNAGLAQAAGKYVTCHDDDDWSHPRKLELQAAHLEEHPEALANMSRHVRASEDLVFTRINVNPSHPQPNFSSLMFRREEVVAKLGRWDLVRKGADGEFKDRIEAAFGTKVGVVSDAPLSFTRTRLDSLTAGEMVRGYIDPRRVNYLRAYQRWHASAPASWRPEDRGGPLTAEAPPPALDLVFATDYRFPGGTSSLTLAEVRAAIDAGYSVGVLQLDSPLNKHDKPRVEGYWQALRAGAHQVTLRDTCAVGGLVVRHPSVLQYADGLSSSLDAAEVVLIVNNPPVLADGGGAPFDVDVAAANAERLFGRRPRVHPESGATRKVLTSVVDPGGIEPQNWLGFVSDSWLGTPRTVAPRTPVVGRHSRDHRLKWPDQLADLRAAYHGAGAFETRVLGGVAQLAAAHGTAASSGWTVYAFNDITPREFLASVDFWVYFHHRDWTESFGMSIAEAMASGCVVVLPTYLQETFGDGAVYCSPAEVRTVVDELWRNPAAYTEQSERGIAFARDNLTEASFRARIAGLLRTGTTG